MKLLIFTLITSSFAFSHAGRIDHYYRDVARTGALKPRPKPLKKESPTLRRNFLRTFNEALSSTSGRKMKAMERLLEDGFNPREDKMGRTALSVAAEAGNAPLVRLLLKYGADVNARGGNGYTALEKALTGRSNVRVIKALIEAGADVNAKDIINQNPLHVAAGERGSSMKIKTLIEVGANKLNVKNYVGQTPLHKASHSGFAEGVKALIKAGARVDARDSQGRAPLHHAKTSAVARALIEAGANVHARDSKGETPLHRVSSVEVAKALTNAGARVDAKGKQGMTPLDLARLHELRAVVKFLEVTELSQNRNYRPRHLNSKVKDF